MSFSDAKKFLPISIEDYLEGEALAKRKHEYVAGSIHVMSGARYAHNLIASRVLGEFHVKLKNGPCEALGSDNKVRIDDGSKSWFYYPDVTVVCGENILNEVYQDKPTIVVEVLSASTRRYDQCEKWESYQKLDSLMTYIMIEQEFAAAIVYQRTPTGFQRSVYDDPNDAIPLPDINASLSLATIYDGVPFTKEAEEEYEVSS